MTIKWTQLPNLAFFFLLFIFIFFLEILDGRSINSLEKRHAGEHIRPPGAKEDFECRFKVGLGTSDYDPIVVDEASGRASCLELCLEKKINGATEDNKRITGVVFSDEMGCMCLIQLLRLDETKTGYETCRIKADRDDLMNNVDEEEAGQELVKPKTSPYPIDMTYELFKNEECDDMWENMGCFRIHNQGRYLLNYTSYIEWESDRMTTFARSFICACAEAARMNDVKYFTTHNWGECWELDPEDMTSPTEEGCYLSGQTDVKCSGIKHFDGVCLGKENYFVYVNVEPVTTRTTLNVEVNITIGTVPPAVSGKSKRGIRVHP